MTITETRPEATGAHSAASAGAPTRSTRPPAAGGLGGWLTTVDHTQIGRLYVVTSLVVALAALGLGAILAYERIDPDGLQLLDGDSVAQLGQLYGFGLAFGVVAPLLLGLACAIVPLQVGAGTIAYARAAAASFWGWVLGTGLMIASFAMNGGPGGGDANGVDLFLGSLALTAVSLLVLAMCLGATIVTLRAPGMFLDEVPMFSWSVLVTAVMLVVTLPVLVGLCILLFVDHRYGTRQVFGGNLALPDHVRWAIEQPQVYVYALPALGFVADAVITTSRARVPMRVVGLVALGLGGFVGFGAFAQAPFAPDGYDDLVYIGTGLAGVLPPLLVLAVGALALRTGKLRLIPPLVWALAAGLMALVGGAVGALTGFGPLELVGTAYQTAQSDYVLLAGLLAGLGGLVYWGPKLWGRRLPAAPSMGLAVLGLLGVVLAAFPQVILGFLDQPARAVEFEEIDAGGLLNGVSALGYVVLVLTILGVAALAGRGFTKGDPAGDDPWEGQTLEWMTSSPPPPDGFVEALAVESPEPLLDRRQVAAAGDGEVVR